MAKLVDALVSGSSAARFAGSSPVPGTKTKKIGWFLFLPTDFFIFNYFAFTILTITSAAFSICSSEHHSVRE